MGIVDSGRQREKEREKTDNWFSDE